MTQAEFEEQEAEHMNDAEQYTNVLERLDALRVAVDALYYLEPPVPVRLPLSEVRGCLLEAKTMFQRAIDARAAEERRKAAERP